MADAGPTIGLDIGPLGSFAWRGDEVVLLVWVARPAGGPRRAVWQVESADGPKLACVYADFAREPIEYPPEGQLVTAAVRQLPGFDEAAFEAA